MATKYQHHLIYLNFSLFFPGTLNGEHCGQNLSQKLIYEEHTNNIKKLWTDMAKASMDHFLFETLARFISR
ncbi:hypothetical protein AAZX31_13G336600 [Glycine max]